MSSAVDDTDVTVQLPDEVLCHIISSLSLSQKLRLESVNHKFQRCIQEELKANPQPLELKLTERKRKLNGHDKVFRYSYNATERILGALETLAKKTKFSGVWVHVGGVFERKSVETLDRVLSLLVSEHRCLTKVTSFGSDSGCTQAVLENFLDKCGKLTSIRFDCDIGPLNTVSFSGISTFPLDLHQLLKNRRLTELALRPFEYPQKGLTDMLQGILPNTLTKLDLCFTGTPRAPELNIAQLVNALGPNWSVLEEICLKFPDPVAPRGLLADLFESLSRLPALRKCDMEFSEIGPENQFVAAMTSLLALSDINITVTVDDDVRPFFWDVPGCQAEAMIRQVQNVYPGLVVDFVRGGSLVLTLGNARWVLKSFLEFIEHCGAEDCVQCQSFYPSLLTLLRSRADDASFDDVDAQHFPNWHLDRCRVRQTVTDLNDSDSIPEDMRPWRAVSVAPNKHQQTVTVNFETAWERNPFNITIGYGHCLTNGCTKCG